MLADGPRDLTTALRTLINNDDMQGAAEALLAAHETGETVLGRSIALRDAIAGVQLPRITPQVAVAFALARCELAARTRQYTAAAADAAFVLERNGARNDEERRLLQMITALADHERGEHESALLQFRRFADDESLSTLERAWAWNNIATFLPLENAECERAACQASDLFLVAGRKIDAARCLVRAARSRLATSPPTAAGFLDQALGWIGEDEDGLEQLVRGGMLQNRARVNMMLGRHDKALKDALASWAELRGLIGSEQVIPTSLAIAVEATQELGEDTSDLLRELDAARRRAEPERHAVRTEILQLLGEFDEVAFRRVSTHPLLSSDASLRAQLLIANALGPPDIPDVERIARMERARNAATESGDRETVTIVLLALAKLLAGFHQEDRALAVFREVHALEPTNREARVAIANLLHQLGKHRDAVRFFEDEEQRWGWRPSLQLGLGRALFHLGDADRAANVLAAVARHQGASDDIRSSAAELRDKALDAGGRLAVPVPQLAVVQRSELESALADFGDYVRRDKRMEFWRREKGSSRRHTWIQQPERLARNFLHTFLEARLGRRMDAFEEVGAGAGRIDLYLTFDGGLSAVVELKMLGGGSYATSYAWAGRSQLVHYMNNRRSSLGYLVVFDARVRDWGEIPADDTANAKHHTITVSCVDVRSTVTA